MKKKNYKALFLLFLLSAGLLLFDACASKNSSENNENPTLQQAIDNIVMPRLKVGAIIGVILRNQRHVFVYGTKSLDSSEAPDSNSIPITRNKT